MCVCVPCACAYVCVCMYEQARFPTTFVVNFDSPPTEYSFGVNRCTPDRVIVPTDYVNPFVNVANPQSFDCSELMATAKTTHFFW